MQLSQALVELKDRGFHYLKDPRLTLALNKGKDALEDEYTWPWLETSVAGAAPLTIPDLKVVQSVWIPGDKQVLVGVDPRDVPDIDGDITIPGQPLVWWLDGLTTVRVYPVDASKTLQVRYVKHSPELVNDTDTPLIPPRYHSLWVDYAVVEAYADSDNFEQANALLNDIRGRRLPQLLEVFAARNRLNPGYQSVSYFNSEDL